MNYRYVRLTPDMAAKWLGTMPEYQRKPSAVVVAEYAKDMADGRWIEETGDAIRFDDKGRMIDGQHRCMAVVSSGVSINVLVVDGLSEDAYKAIDKGKKRTAAETVGGKNATARSAIARALLALRNGVSLGSILAGACSNEKNPISMTEVAEVMTEHEEAVSAVLAPYMVLKKVHNGRFSTLVATCLAAHAAELSGEDDAFARFVEDLDRPVYERPAVCTMAREKASSFSVETGGKVRNTRLFAIYAVALKAWLEGTTPKVLQTSQITRDVGSVAVKREMWQ